MNLITAAQFEREMKDIKNISVTTGDDEYGHRQADELLCKTLKSLGYEAGVKIYEGMTKWYG